MMNSREGLRAFFENDKAGGILLIVGTAISLVLANFFPPYIDFWQISIGSHNLTHWINDGLMVIFFLAVGLDLKKEFFAGELSQIRRAITPLIAAVGGVIIPATIYYLINKNTGDLRGVGIPMATDIVFALGVLSLLGDRVPLSLKIFLMALAVIDDLYAILVIAIFYSQTIELNNLAVVIGIFILLIVLNRLKVQSLVIYLSFGVVMWYFMLHSGIHPSITGVLVASVIPFSETASLSLSHKVQSWLHKPVTFIILPLFAIANTGIPISNDVFGELSNPISLGIILGLLIGKPLGIFVFTFLTVKLRLGSIPLTLAWKHIFGIGLLGGIGFTVSIFISLLAFENPDIIDQAKISVLVASLAAGISGYIYMSVILRSQNTETGI